MRQISQLARWSHLSYTSGMACSAGSAELISANWSKPVPDVLTTVLTAIGSVAVAIGGPAATSVAENRREGRLRKSISDNIDLAERIEKGEAALKPKAAAVRQLVMEQMDALVQTERQNLSRKRGWSTLGGGVLAFALVVWLPLWMWTIDAWWAKVIATVSTVLVVVIVIAAVWGFFAPSAKKSAPEAST
jgi:hypothetical protein